LPCQLPEPLKAVLFNTAAANVLLALLADVFTVVEIGAKLPTQLPDALAAAAFGVAATDVLLALLADVFTDVEVVAKLPTQLPDALAAAVFGVAATDVLLALLADVFTDVEIVTKLPTQLPDALVADVFCIAPADDERLLPQLLEPLVELDEVVVKCLRGRSLCATGPVGVIAVWLATKWPASTCATHSIATRLPTPPAQVARPRMRAAQPPCALIVCSHTTATTGPVAPTRRPASSVTMDRAVRKGYAMYGTMID
jgi:hypothetical protein